MTVRLSRRHKVRIVPTGIDPRAKKITVRLRFAKQVKRTGRGVRYTWRWWASLKLRLQEDGRMVVAGPRYRSGILVLIVSAGHPRRWLRRRWR